MSEAIDQNNAGSARQQLIDMARHNIKLVKDQRIDQTEDVMRVPASHYFDQSRWRQEMEQVFKRMPLMLAMSCELKDTGDFKAMEVCGVPVLMVRHADGAPRAYINSCSHRGAVIVTERSGKKSRFTCPYHAWVYDHDGALASVYSEEDFGCIDKSTHGLVPLPVGERAGMVWVTLDPNSTLDLDTFLCGYDELLEQFGFADWELFEHRTVAGPNWKVAYDGYMDLYHLPILHKNTFGSSMPHQASYNAWGPHQRVSSPNPLLLELEDKPEEEWPTDALMSSVWTIFPHISIASFDGGGGRGVMISQLFPGETPEQSFTVQNYVMENLPANDEMREAATAQFKLLEYVVEQEDYATGIALQKAIKNRPGFEVLFGRNEEGGQRFHGFLDELIACDDADLAKLFDN
jgi:phenylpropionate dioxygenase-like ring-hydroxylating dioxygenase large terminal subunit